MKIEVDLNDILGDEFGAETLQESVRRQVIAKMTDNIKDGVGKKIDAEVATVINGEIKKVVESQMPLLLNNLMDAKYTPVSTYGSRSEPTSVREELVKMVSAQMIYEKRNYNSDKNAFTKAVDGVVDAKVSEFQKLFTNTVDANFIAEAMNYATKKLADRLQVKA